MLEVLNWASDHWLFVIALASIAAAAYALPKLALAAATVRATERFGR